MSSSQKEIEARWLNLDAAEMRRRLEKINAVKEGSFFFKEWIFTKPEWKAKNKRLRVRSDGTKGWVTLKTNETFEVASTQEVEMEVSNPELAVELIKATGLPLVRHQEKKRERAIASARSASSWISGRRSLWCSRSKRRRRPASAQALSWLGSNGKTPSS